MSDTHGNNEDWNLVHVYTRAQAMTDGVLVDVSATAAEAGFRIPVALTLGVWADCVSWSASDTEHTAMPQDEAGRLWDVIWMARAAARAERQGGSRRTSFTVLRVPRGDRKSVV